MMKKLFKNFILCALFVIGLSPAHILAAETDSIVVNVPVSVQGAQNSGSIKSVTTQVSISPIGDAPAPAVAAKDITGEGQVILGQITIDRPGDYYYEIRQTLTDSASNAELHGDAVLSSNPYILRIYAYTDEGTLKTVMYGYKTTESAAGDIGTYTAGKDKTDDFTFSVSMPEETKKEPSKTTGSEGAHTAAQIDNGAGYMLLIAGSTFILVLLRRKSKKTNE